MNIKYPKQAKVKKNTNNKTTNNQNNDCIDEIEKLKYQIDDLESNSHDLRIKNSSNLDQITQIANTVSQHTDSISTNANNISNLQTAVGTNTNDISTLKSTVAGHTTSIGTNTGNISTLQTAVGTNTTNIGLHATRLTNLETLTSSHTTQIGHNTSNIAINTEDIASLQTAVSNLQNATGVTTEFTDLADDVEDLTDAVEDIQDDITDLQTAVAGKQDTLTAGDNITIQNGIISSTGGISSVTASDVDSESATNGQVLTADGQGGASWQTVSGGGSGGASCNCASDIADLQTTVATNTSEILYLKKYVVHPDPYFKGTTPSEFPAGTIYQTYDCDERNLMISSQTTITTPYIFFLAESGSAATIKIEEKFKVQTALSSVSINVILNDTNIYNEILTVNDLDTEQTFYHEFDGVSLNSNGKSNSLVIELALQQSNGNKVLILTKQKVELLAPNAEIITKVCSFSAETINDTYYFADCKNGTTKVASINGSDILNLESLNWNDTNIYAQFYSHAPVFENYGGNYIVKEVASFYKSYDNTNNIKSPSSNWNAVISGWTFDFLPFICDNATLFLLSQNQSGTLRTTRVNFTSSNYTNTSGSATNLAAIFGSRSLITYNSKVPSTRYFTVIDKNGNAYFKTNLSANSGTNYLDLGQYTYARAYFTRYVTDSNFDMDIYCKAHGVVYKKSYTYTNYTFNLISTIEIGSYDYIFPLANNDYCAVKFNKMTYHKFPEN